MTMTGRGLVRQILLAIRNTFWYVRTTVSDPGFFRSAGIPSACVRDWYGGGQQGYRSLRRCPRRRAECDRGLLLGACVRVWRWCASTCDYRQGVDGETTSRRVGSVGLRRGGEAASPLPFRHTVISSLTQNRHTHLVHKRHTSIVTLHSSASQFTLA